MIAIKIRLYPTKKQESLMWKSAGVSRYAYNWGLGNKIESFKKDEKLSIPELRKMFTKLRNSEEFCWLKEVSADIPQQALRDLDVAYKRFFQEQKNGVKYTPNKVKKAQRLGYKLSFYDLNGYPKFKKKGKSEVSFFFDPRKIVVKDKTIRIEKIGYVKMNDEDRLPLGNYKQDKIRVSNPRVKHNGKYWYIVVSYEKEVEETILTQEIIGIDLGISDLAIVSNIEKPFKNINKSKEVKRLKKKLKRLQRKISRKYDKLKSGKSFKKGERVLKTNNIIKLEKIIKLIHRKISNIRLNHLHQTTNTIVKTKPCRIVVEDLNVKGMLKNKHLSKAISEQCFNMFINQIQYKCKKYGIEFVKADRFFPSSKTCSCCGTIKKDLKLKDRTFKCPNEECNLVIDRDKNASFNLARYKLA